MSGGLFETVFVPIANPKDAEATARAIHHYANPESEIIVTHVVEKAGGAPDKVSVEQREHYAEEAYETFVDVLPDHWENIRFQTLYGRDVAATISEGAEETEATVIAFTPRGGSRWAQIVTGDIARNLIDISNVSVISLPEQPTSIVL